MNDLLEFLSLNRNKITKEILYLHIRRNFFKFDLHIKLWITKGKL